MMVHQPDHSLPAVVTIYIIASFKQYCTTKAIKIETTNYYSNLIAITMVTGFLPSFLRHMAY